MSDKKEPGWRILSGRTLFDNPWLRLRRHKALAPTGAPADYVMVHFKKLAVGVLPLDDEGFVHLVGQMRFSFGAYSWEAPEGGCEPDEDPLDCARRELAEESGLQASIIEKILELDLSNSVTDEQAICYIGLSLSPAEGRMDDVERIRRRRLPFGAALAEANQGRIRDAMTVAMLLKAHHMAVTGRLPGPLAAKMLASVRDEAEESRHG